MWLDQISVVAALIRDICCKCTNADEGCQCAYNGHNNDYSAGFPSVIGAIGWFSDPRRGNRHLGANHRYGEGLIKRGNSGLWMALPLYQSSQNVWVVFYVQIHRPQYQDWYPSVFEGNTKLNVQKSKEIWTVLCLSGRYVLGDAYPYPL